MMPPFPSSPLSAVQRVFPSTAARLACQAGPSQHVDQLKPTSQRALFGSTTPASMPLLRYPRRAATDSAKALPGRGPIVAGETGDVVDQAS